EFSEKVLAGIADAKVDFEMVTEGGFDQLALVFPEQAVVNENADELVADGFVEEGRDHGGIDAAGQAADDFAEADLLADRSDGVLGEVPHRPVSAAAADFVDEVLEDLLAARRVG